MLMLVWRLTAYLLHRRRYLLVEVNKTSSPYRHEARFIIEQLGVESKGDAPYTYYLSSAQPSTNSWRRTKSLQYLEGSLGWKSFKVCSNGPRSRKKRATVTRPDLPTWWRASGRSSCSVLSGNSNCRSWIVYFKLCQEHFVPATRGITRDEQCSLPHVRSSVGHLRRNLLFHLST